MQKHHYTNAIFESHFLIKKNLIHFPKNVKNDCFLTKPGQKQKKFHVCKINFLTYRDKKAEI